MSCNCVGPNGACPCMPKVSDINASPFIDRFDEDKNWQYRREWFDKVDEPSRRLFTERFKADMFKTIGDLESYIEGIQGPDYHYASEESGIQTFDAWDASGSLVTTCRDTARKYLDRYGKKDGNNPKDLLKALHYILIMYYKNHKDK